LSLSQVSQYFLESLKLNKTGEWGHRLDRPAGEDQSGGGLEDL